MDLTPKFQTEGPDFEAVKELFERLEFRTLIKRLPALEREQRAKTIERGGPLAPTTIDGGGTGEGALNPAPQHYWGRGGPTVQIITTQAQLDALLVRFADTDAPAGMQLHTSPPPGVKPAGLTLMNAELHGIAFGLPDSAWYAAWADWGQALTPFLEDAARAKSVYDLKFVAGVLGRNGVTLRGVAFDALLAAYLLNAGRAGYPLADLAADSAGIELLADPDNPQAAVMDQACAIHALEAALDAAFGARRPHGHS